MIQKFLVLAVYTNSEKKIVHPYIVYSLGMAWGEPLKNMDKKLDM